MKNWYLISFNTLWGKRLIETTRKVSREKLRPAESLPVRKTAVDVVKEPAPGMVRDLSEPEIRRETTAMLNLCYSIVWSLSFSLHQANSSKLSNQNESEPLSSMHVIRQMKSYKWPSRYFFNFTVFFSWRAD